MSGWSPSEPFGADIRRAIDVFARNRRALRTAAAAIGVLSLVAAVAVAAGVGGSRVDDAVGALAGSARLFVYLFAHLAVALGAWSLWQARGDRVGGGSTTLPDPADAGRTADRVVGDSVDETLRRLADPSDVVELRGRIDVERAIREAVIDVLRNDSDTDFEDVRAAIDEGTWTDDPRAAAYVGDVELPVRLRVIDWASGDPYRRRVEATVAELAAIAGVETEVESP
ncbi:DUF7269 family protein [Halosimplex amylolyticum]|uniref:DUF7269 family protein n=1 Tax=Halosimplex amylolyticum TaxID=3396616 RepID=UPI003F565972